MLENSDWSTNQRQDIKFYHIEGSKDHEGTLTIIEFFVNLPRLKVHINSFEEGTKILKTLKNTKLCIKFF